MALDADQAQQPHEVVWAPIPVDNPTGASLARIAPLRPTLTSGFAGWLPGEAGGWLLRPLTSLDGLVPDCRERVDRDPVCLRQLAGAAGPAPPLIKR